MEPNPSQRDELTRLFNRKAFNEELETALAGIGAGEPVSMALIDIDHFLRLNQTYGHEGGDLVLKAVASQLRQAAGSDSLCARYGGDEFAVIFPGAEREQAFLALETLRRQMENLEVDQGEGQPPISGITLSAGVAAYAIDGRTSAELLRKADQALYRAKEKGRNTVRLAYEERLVPKTTHFTLTQLERLSKLAEQRSLSEAELLREALDELLKKYGVNPIER